MIQALKNLLKRLAKSNQEEFGDKKLSCHKVYNTEDNNDGICHFDS